VNTLSSHVLDTALGKPAVDMQVELTLPNGDSISKSTNHDGRCADWGKINFDAGVYHIRFQTGQYLLKHHGSQFYPYVDVHFEIVDEGGHYHIPLLISPFGFSSYRGS
jgi:5-hydroxyisourate hydrolase